MIDNYHVVLPEKTAKLIKKAILFGKIKVSSVEDIACIKLQTIGMRGSKKDFIDLFYILDRYSMESLFKMLKKKYPDTEYSEIHILKSLVYFDNAESQPMPRVQDELSWEEIKRKITKVVVTFKW